MYMLSIFFLDTHSSVQRDGAKGTYVTELLTLVNDQVFKIVTIAL